MSQASSGSTLPYIGSKLSLISNSEIRYEGVLYTINTQESTVALQDVRSFGTEGRKIPDIPPSMEIYDFIVFRGKDIKDLTVCEPAKPVLNDPAIVTMDIHPPPQQVQPAQGAPGSMEQSHQIHHGAMGGQYGERSYGDRQGYDRYGQGGGSQPHGGAVNRSGGMMYNSGGPRDDMRMPRGGYGGYHMYGGGARRYGSNFSSRGGRGGRHVVGELPAQPNQVVKSQVSGDFDFEGANQKFEKGHLKPEELEKEAGVQMGGYDNKSSFFDSISCETLDRQAGHETKIDRDKQRQMDTETFGASAVHRGPRYRRGFSRAGGGYRRGMYGNYGGYGGFGGGGGYGGGRGSYGRQGF